MWPRAGFSCISVFIGSPPDPPNRRRCQREEMKRSGVSIFFPTYRLSKSTQVPLPTEEKKKKKTPLDSTLHQWHPEAGWEAGESWLGLPVPEWETVNSIWVLVNQWYLPLAQKVGRSFFCGFGRTRVRAYPPPFPSWVETQRLEWRQKEEHTDENYQS